MKQRSGVEAFLTSETFNHTHGVRRFVQWRPADPRLRERANVSLEEPAVPDVDKAHWHACTKKTRSVLTQASPDRSGALKVEGVGVASVKVAPETVPRALAVLDDLICAVEDLGWVNSRPRKTFK